MHLKLIKDERWLFFNLVIEFGCVYIYIKIPSTNEI
jgi:hypothetical protein